MKRVFYIKDSTENKISYYHLLFFLFALPFDRLYSTLILISFLVHTIIFFKKDRLKEINGNTLIIQAVFIVTLLSTSYAVSVPHGFDIVSKQLAIFLFPLLLSVTSLDVRKYRAQLLEGFVLCCTLTVIYLFFDALHIILFNKLPLTSLFSSSFVNHNFSLPIDMHATYLSMLLVIALVYTLQQLVSVQQTRTRMIYYIFCLLVLLAGLIQLSSKSVFIALAVIVLIGFPWFIIKKENRLRFVFISLTGFIAMAVFFLSVDAFRNRYVVTLTDDLYENKNIVESNGRIDRWSIAVDLIKKSPIIGTGSGSEIGLLKDLYFEHKMYRSFVASLNAHNQYLSFMINSGVIGVLIYLAVLFRGFRESIKYLDIFLFSFIALIVIVSFSEDLLDVNKGIFFYAFFFSLFLIPARKTFFNIIYDNKDQP